MTGDPETLSLSADPHMPNSRLPVLIYRGVAAPDGFEALFTANGWGGTWRNGIFDFDHYHSISHEALGIEAGEADVQLGGDTGEALHVSAGDVLVLPAGTGHRRIQAGPGLSVIGAYPPGQAQYDICRERGAEADARIARVPLPDSDPVHGADGPLTRLWR